jgi:LPS-assembly lipoprotein
LLVVAASSCGFQIRGVADVPPEMQRTYIATADRHSGFYQALRRELSSAGIELVDSPVDATSIFNIHTDITNQRVLSVSARNVPTEYEVFYIVNYSLVSGPTTLMQPRTQTQTRFYTWDETLVLGKQMEQQTLRDAIVGDLVRVVMIQLSSI